MEIYRVYALAPKTHGRATSAEARLHFYGCMTARGP